MKTAKTDRVQTTKGFKSDLNLENFGPTKFTKSKTGELTEVEGSLGRQGSAKLRFSGDQVFITVKEFPNSPSGERLATDKELKQLKNALAQFRPDEKEKFAPAVEASRKLARAIETNNAASVNLKNFNLTSTSVARNGGSIVVQGSANRSQNVTIEFDQGTNSPTKGRILITVKEFNQSAKPQRYATSSEVIDLITRLESPDFDPGENAALIARFVDALREENVRQRN